MLIIENNSVYEIDEDCIRNKKVPKECHTLEKLQMLQQEQKKTAPGMRNGSGRFTG